MNDYTENFVVYVAVELHGVKTKEEATKIAEVYAKTATRMISTADSARVVSVEKI